MHTLYTNCQKETSLLSKILTFNANFQQVLWGKYGLLTIFVLLVMARGGREVIGLSIFGISVGIYFLFWLSKRNTIPLSVFTIPFLSFIFWYLITCFYSLNPIMGAVHFLSLLVYFIVMHLSIESDSDEIRKKFVNLYILSSIILSIVVCIQFSFNWKNYIRLGILPSAHFPNHNLLAGFLTIGIIFILGKLFVEKKLDIKQVLFYWLSAVIIITAMVITFSRGAWIGLISGIFLLFLSDYRKILRTFFGFLILLLVLFIVVPQDYSAKWFAHKFLNPIGKSRLIIWQTCFNAFTARPLTGWGAGSLREAYLKFSVPAEWEIGRYSNYTRFAHNEYLDLATETGLIGLALYLWLIYSVFSSMKKSIEEPFIRYFLSAIVSIFVHSFFDFNLHLPVIFYTLSFLVGISAKKEKSLKMTLPIKNIGYAMSIFIILINISLFTSQTMLYLGEREQSKNEFTQAYRYYNIACIYNPLNFLAWQKKAQVSNSPTEAERSYKIALLLNPNDSFINYELAHLYSHNNRIDDSIEEYKLAIKKNPYNPFFRFELAELLLKKGLIKSAKVLYQEAVKLEPFYLLAHYRLGQLGEKSSLENIKKILEANIKPDTNYSQRLLFLPEEIRKKLK